MTYEVAGRARRARRVRPCREPDPLAVRRRPPGCAPGSCGVLAARPCRGSTGTGRRRPGPGRGSRGTARTRQKPPWLRLTMPEPSHVGQTRGTVPVVAPVPPQVGQAASLVSRSGTVRPASASRTTCVTSASTSAPAARPAGCCRAPPTVEQATEQVADTVADAAPVWPNRSPQVEPRPPAPPPAAAGRRSAPPRRTGPRLVVLLAALLVRQHVVGLGDLLEPRPRRRCRPGWRPGGAPGPASVGLLDLARRWRPS